MNDLDGYGWDGYPTGYDLIAEPDRADRVAAIEIVEATLAPTPPPKILAALARVRLLTASRDQAAVDLKLIGAAYVEELRQYPVDAIEIVLREWPKRNRFWPTIAELIEHIEPLVAPRRALLHALQRGYREPETSPHWMPPGPPGEAEKNAVAAILAEHGLTLDDIRHERPQEREPVTPAQRQQVAAETRTFRLAPPDDPRVAKLLAEMGSERELVTNV